MGQDGRTCSVPAFSPVEAAILFSFYSQVLRHTPALFAIHTSAKDWDAGPSEFLQKTTNQFTWRKWSDSE